MKTRGTSIYSRSFYAIVLFVALSAFTVQPAFAGGGKTLVGSWLVEVQLDDGSPAFRNLATFDWSGTAVIAGDSGDDPGHGAWKRVGGRQYTMKFVVLMDPTAPPFASLLTVTGDVVIKPGGKIATGRTGGTFSNEHGDMFFVEGDVTFTRIEID